MPLDAGGPLTRQALATGIVDVALLFSTDPAIGDDDLVELVDDRALQPAENVTPIVRRAVVDRFGPRLVDTLDAVSARLDTETLRDLNARAGRAFGPRDGYPVGSTRSSFRDARDPHRPAGRRHRSAHGTPHAAPPSPDRRGAAAAAHLGTSGTAWLVAAGVALLLTVVAGSSEAVARAVNQIDSAILRQVAGLRTDWLTDVADAIDRVGSGWTITVDRLRGC